MCHSALRNLTEQLTIFSDDLDEFIHINSENSTFMFWIQYLKFVDILLHFIRAEREGNWDLHLTSFQKMLPLMVLYDHTNYTCWGTIYLTDMLKLEKIAPTVYHEFQTGNFVVKETTGTFNQVSTDMALEHINRMCQTAGGLVGITQNKSALDRWMLTCCARSQLV